MHREAGRRGRSSAMALVERLISPCGFGMPRYMANRLCHQSRANRVIWNCLDLLNIHFSHTKLISFVSNKFTPAFLLLLLSFFTFLIIGKMNSLRTIARRAYTTVHPGGRPGVSQIMRPAFFSWNWHVLDCRLLMALLVLLATPHL